MSDFPFYAVKDSGEPFALVFYLDVVTYYGNPGLVDALDRYGLERFALDRYALLDCHHDDIPDKLPLFDAGFRICDSHSA
jgi:hypothetical protein